MISVSGDSVFGFPIQLAACIEKKFEVSEDYQDCIGSEDQIDSTTEVKDFAFLLFVVRLNIMLLKLLIFLKLICTVNINSQ